MVGEGENGSEERDVYRENDQEVADGVRFTPEAEEGADCPKKTYKGNLVPYRCGTCGMWHLCPKGRQVPSEKCPFCTGTNGQAKDAYRNQREALRRVDILRKEQGVSLKVCAYEHSDA